MSLVKYGFGGMVVVSLAACGGTTKKPESPLHDEPGGQPCAALMARSPDEAPVAMLVEIARYDATQDSASVEPGAPPLRSVQIASALVEPNKLTRVPWTACEKDDCESSPVKRLTLRIEHLPDNFRDAAKLELGSEEDPTALTVITTTNQKSASVTTSNAALSNAIVTPYYLFAPQAESLRVLGQCKSQRVKS